MAYKSKFKGAEIDARLEKMVNVTYAELVNLRDGGKLIAGQMYRMTDYETTCGWENTQCAGHPFDLVLTALDNKTLDEKCSAIWSERDTDGYFANSNLPAWDVRYCLDKDKARFDWAQQAGKYLIVDSDGYIYNGRLNGTYTLDGVTYKKWDAYSYGELLYILTMSENPSEGDEAIIGGDQYDTTWAATVLGVESVADDGKGVIYRITDESENSVPYDFKNIMFLRPLTEGVYDAENGVDTFCYTFCCIDWDTFKIEDMSVSTPRCCYSNKFDVNCYDNVFLTFSTSYCCSNTFGDGCYANTFGDSCYANTFGEYCSYNTFGEYCDSNTFGDDCSYNTFGDSCYANTFGEYCYENTIVNSCQYLNFGDACSYITLLNDETASDENMVQYYEFNCVSGRIQVYRGRVYQTFVTVAGVFGSMVEYTVEDFIQGSTPM